MALVERARRNAPKGKAKPRVAPPTPARSDLAGYLAIAADIGIDLMPWQHTAARYIEALAADDRHLYREVAIVVARQNGKTTLLVPLIVRRLLEGKRIMHTAQDRAMPRDIFYWVADIMWEKHRALFPMRNDRPTKPRYASGQEEIRLSNGAIYSIVAPNRSGARGPSRDLVIIDELREMDTWDFIAASKPTITASRDPQMLYLSNAGEEDSVVLNAIRDRAGSDPALAYLEWSAAPERATDDRAGWTEANPAIGNERGEMGDVMETLGIEHRTARLEGTMSKFETEHLCRWVVTTREPLVDAFAWAGCRSDAALTPSRPFMAVSMDPEARRASVAIAWQLPDGNTAVKLLFNVTGDPIDTDKLGKDVRLTANRLGVTMTGFDPLTDAELAKYLTRKKPVNGREFAGASSQFVTLVTGGKVRWWDAEAVTDDLTWTARKLDTTDKGSFEAVRAKDDRPITASLAAIRAVWLASGPKPASPRVL